jgi:hypothetical protein
MVGSFAFLPLMFFCYFGRAAGRPGGRMLRLLQM